MREGAHDYTVAAHAGGLNRACRRAAPEAHDVVLMALRVDDGPLPRKSHSASGARFLHGCRRRHMSRTSAASRREPLGEEDGRVLGRAAERSPIWVRQEVPVASTAVSAAAARTAGSRSRPAMATLRS